MGLSPTGKRRLGTAHTLCGRWPSQSHRRLLLRSGHLGLAPCVTASFRISAVPPTKNRWRIVGTVAHRKLLFRRNAASRRRSASTCGRPRFTRTMRPRRGCAADSAPTQARTSLNAWVTPRRPEHVSDCQFYALVRHAGRQACQRLGLSSSARADPAPGVRFRDDASHLGCRDGCHDCGHPGCGPPGCGRQACAAPAPGCRGLPARDVAG